jgi:hypothetical protein
MAVGAGGVGDVSREVTTVAIDQTKVITGPNNTAGVTIHVVLGTLPGTARVTGVTGVSEREAFANYVTPAKERSD